MGVLSRHPIVEAGFRSRPAMQEVQIDLGSQRLRLVNAHPFPAPFGSSVLGIPVGFDPSRRNEELKLIRASVDARLSAGELVVMGGDFNTSPTEPAFEELVAGLRDAHAEVGLGPGWTWRPSPLEALGTGLLRIDIVAAGPELQPVASAVSCPSVGDHCIVTATLRLPSPSE